MSDLVIGVGDRLPIVTRTVEVDGTAVDLTGGSVVFAVYDPSDMSTVLSEAGTINSPATAGSVTYQWSSTAATTLTTGNYLARFIVTIGSRNLSVPNSGYLTLLVSGGGTGSFTYTGDPEARQLDAVRFMIGDTDPDDPMMLDAEIEYLLGQSDSVYQAAHDACYVLATKFNRLANETKQVGDLSISKVYVAKVSSYREMAERFMELATRRDVPVPWANAQSLKATVDREVETRDTDFYLGQTDYRW